MTHKSALWVPEVTLISLVASTCTDLPLPSTIPTSTYSSSNASDHHDSLTNDTYVPSVAFPSTVTTHPPYPLPSSDLLHQTYAYTTAFQQMIDSYLYPNHYMSISLIIACAYPAAFDPNIYPDHPK